MKRKILFRGKRIDNGEWVEGYNRCIPCLNRHDIFPVNPKNASEHYTVDPATVGQYTGLVDRNGTMIFEGDIVVERGDDDEMAVEWHDDTARFVLSGDDTIADFDNYWGYELEVVGNIHDREGDEEDG